MGKKRPANKIGKKVNVNELKALSAEFGELTMKAYKKQSKKNGTDYFTSKKELRESYYDYLNRLLPYAINYLVAFGYRTDEDIQTIKNGVFEKLYSDEYKKYVALIADTVSDDVNNLENAQFLPIIIKDLLCKMDEQNQLIRAEDPKAPIYEADNLVDLSRVIMKKKLKKMKKSGVNKDLAFDVLSIIPVSDALDFSSRYRMNAMNGCLMAHSVKLAETTEIPVNEIFDIVFDDEVRYGFVISYLLLAGKDQFTKLSEAEQKTYLAITKWALGKMEAMKPNEVYAILTYYIKVRVQDKSQGKDYARRLVLTDIPESEYPKTKKVIDKYALELSDENKKLL